jgi:NTP pyrophosphatase (non-canonical NTP hydrolase)
MLDAMKRAAVGKSFQKVIDSWLKKFPKEKGEGHIKYYLQEQQELLDELAAHEPDLDKIAEEAGDSIITTLVVAGMHGVKGRKIIDAICGKYKAVMNTRDYIWDPINEFYIRKDKLSPEELDQIEEATKVLGEEA